MIRIAPKTAARTHHRLLQTTMRLGISWIFTSTLLISTEHPNHSFLEPILEISSTGTTHRTPRVSKLTVLDSPKI